MRRKAHSADITGTDKRLPRRCTWRQLIKEAHQRCSYLFDIILLRKLAKPAKRVCSKALSQPLCPGGIPCRDKADRKLCCLRSGIKSIALAYQRRHWVDDREIPLRSLNLWVPSCLLLEVFCFHFNLDISNDLQRPPFHRPFLDSGALRRDREDRGHSTTGYLAYVRHVISNTLLHILLAMHLAYNLVHILLWNSL